MYRKITATSIFDGTRFLPGSNALVLQNDGTIAGIEPVTETNRPDCEYFEGIICPGFVNAHCHTELSYLHNVIPKHTGLPAFVKEVIFSRTGDDAMHKQDAISSSVSAMYNAGINAVGDICNTADSIAAKTTSPVVFKNFVEVSGMVDAGAHERFAAANKVLETFKSRLPNQQSSLTPHAPYSVGKQLFNLLNAATAGTISIHNQECAAEDELFIHGGGDFINLYKALGIPQGIVAATGITSLQNWLPHFTKQQPLLCVHNIYTPPQDLQLLQALSQAGRTIFLCVCPGANLYIENCLPPTNFFNLKGVTYVVGTDSLASNGALSILDELKLLANNYAQLSLAMLLQFATFNGAKALDMHNQLGSITIGKRPGLILLEQNDTKMLHQDTICRRLF